MFNATIDKARMQKLVKQLEQLGRAKANKILSQELKPAAKEALQYVRSITPKDTGKLRRSFTVKKVKSKRRYTFAYRIFARYVHSGKVKTVTRGRRNKTSHQSDEVFYAFAPEYGVTKGRGKQPAHYMMLNARRFAESRSNVTYARIGKALAEAWRKK